MSISRMRRVQLVPSCKPHPLVGGVIDQPPLVLIPNQSFIATDPAFPQTRATCFKSGNPPNAVASNPGGFETAFGSTPPELGVGGRFGKIRNIDFWIWYNSSWPRI
jgi:hypothetical protein